MSLRRPVPRSYAARAVSALLILFTALNTAPGARAEAGAAETLVERATAFREALDSPVAHVREEAARSLGHALGADRGLGAALLDAWPKAGARAQEAFGAAILRHGDDAARRTVMRRTFAAPDVDALPLLRAWASDPAALDALDRLAAADESAFADPLAWGLGSDAEASRLRTLVDLVARARVEALLTARKSPTGHTGYYRGQYAELARHPRRDIVLSVLLGIGLDDRMPFPRAVGLGAYAPLVPQDIRFYEWRSMALNALGEVATPDDEDVLYHLRGWYEAEMAAVVERRDRLMASLGGFGRRRNAADNDSAFVEKMETLGERFGLVADVLTTIYNITPAHTAPEVDAYLEELDRWPYFVLSLVDMRPQVLIRTARYGEAIDEYRRALAYGLTTAAVNHYNMACAYACWSRDPGGEDPDSLRRRALLHLEQAVAAGWRDLGWMEEDGDLDPLRDMPGYARLRDRLQAELDELLRDDDAPR